MLAGAFLILVITGCSQQTIKIEDTSTATLSAATQAPSPTPEPTPVKTTEPETAVTPAKTAEPTPTAKPDDGRAEIADGFYYIKLDDDIKARIKGLSYPADDKDCKISYDDLRYVKLKHYDFDGNIKDGELIVNKRLAKEVTEIFYELYQEKYPLTSVKLVDDYGQPADDTLSMEANNTSAFCYRTVFGGGHLSRHSYGAAIDINPKLNPYLDNGRIAPENGAQYADRSQDFPGKIDHKDLAYKLFKKHGWEWGGDWSGDKDYQHFSKDLGY
jgi:hypothetical protein